MCYRTWVIRIFLFVAWIGTAFGQRPVDTLTDKPFDKLSDQSLSDWGQAARRINTDKWQQGETPHFIIHYFKSGQRVATRCEEFYAEIREFFGNRPDLRAGKKSHVFAFHDAADWERFVPVTGMRNIAGVTRQHEFFYLATKPGGGFDYDGKVQAHEMTHLVFNRFFEGRIPLWLNEGVAEYFGQRKTSTTTEFRRYMSQAVDYPLDRLFAATQYPANPAETRSFYAEAAIVVDFLSYTADRKPLLPKFVDALSQGKSLADALALYGYKNLAEFEAAYGRFRKTRYK